MSDPLSLMCLAPALAPGLYGVSPDRDLCAEHAGMLCDHPSLITRVAVVGGCMAIDSAEFRLAAPAGPNLIYASGEGLTLRYRVDDEGDLYVRATEKAEPDRRGSATQHTSREVRLDALEDWTGEVGPSVWIGQAGVRGDAALEHMLSDQGSWCEPLGRAVHGDVGESRQERATELARAPCLARALWDQTEGPFAEQAVQSLVQLTTDPLELRWLLARAHSLGLDSVAHPIAAQYVTHPRVGGSPEVLVAWVEEVVTMGAGRGAILPVARRLQELYWLPEPELRDRLVDLLESDEGPTRQTAGQALRVLYDRPEDGEELASHVAEAGCEAQIELLTHPRVAEALDRMAAAEVDPYYAGLVGEAACPAVREVAMTRLRARLDLSDAPVPDAAWALYLSTWQRWPELSGRIQGFEEEAPCGGPTREGDSAREQLFEALHAERCPDR